jgi:hypothetical protein
MGSLASAARFRERRLPPGSADPLPRSWPSKIAYSDHLRIHSRRGNTVPAAAEQAAVGFLLTDGDLHLHREM